MATTSRRSFVRPLRSSRNGRRSGATIHGVARVGRRTKDLVKKLGSQDVAVIDHRNLDRIAAEELAACGVRAVVNVSPSSDGSYPNAGPLTLVRAGVPLVDVNDPAFLERVPDGGSISIEGGRVSAGGELLAEGRLLEADELARELDDQRRRIDHALHDFTENTMAHIREEGELLSGTIDFPETRTVFRDRHVLIVVRGTDHVKDLRALRAYIRDVRPVLVGVDGGADAIVKEGLKPDLVLGDMDSAREGTLRTGAELIVHAYPDGSAPGAERLQGLGLAHTVVPSAGTSEDVAMLLASEKGASLIVSVGAHFNLVEFLDKQRGGMSSTFLTRLRIGETLVDAKGVSRLYNPGLSLSHMTLFFAAFVILATIVILTTPALENLVDLLWLKIKVVLGYSARYHAASLAAVFLALAVGILIGAGLGDNLLSDTEESLRESLEGDIEDARGDADDLRVQLDRERAFADRAYPGLVGDTLDGRRVGVLAFGDLSEEVSNDIESALEPTGAELAEVAVVRRPADLAAIADGLGPKFDSIEDDDEAVEELGHLLGEQLVAGQGKQLDKLRDLLFSRSSGEGGGLSGVILVRGPIGDTAESDPEGAASTKALESGLVTGVAETGVPAVAVERSSIEESSIPFFAPFDVATVDSIDLTSGKVALVFALLGAEGNFGIKETANSLLPELLQPRRSAPAP